MTFEEICSFRDDMLRIKSLKRKLEITYQTVHSPSYAGTRQRSRTPTDKTAKAAMNAAMIREDIEELTRKHQARLHEVEEDIKTYAYNAECEEMARQYFIEGKELGQIKSYAEKNGFYITPIDAVYHFLKQIQAKDETEK